MNKCRDCGGPLTTYQGINTRPEDAEVFCEYCEANRPTHEEIVDHVTKEALTVGDKPCYWDPNKPWEEVGHVYLSLHTEAPEPCTELYGGAYKRQPVQFGTPSNGCAWNSTMAEFFFRRDMQEVTFLGIYDAPEDGNLLFSSELSNRIKPFAGDTIMFQQGFIKIEIT